MNTEDVKNYCSSKTKNKYTHLSYVYSDSTLFIDSPIKHGLACYVLRIACGAHTRVVH